MKIETHKVTLLHSTPNPEKVIEDAGRLCYKSEAGDGSEAKFIRGIIGKQHDSVLEHASAGFIIRTDRGITHELVRHRIASFSQTSTRYCNYSKDRFGSEITVICPSFIPRPSAEFEDWREACQVAESCYMCLLEHGVKPQEARSVLPTCTMSEVAMTANLREWRHFLKLRLAPSAHPDMRVVAGAVRDWLVVLAPTVFEEFSREEA